MLFQIWFYDKIYVRNCIYTKKNRVKHLIWKKKPDNSALKRLFWLKIRRKPLSKLSQHSLFKKTNSYTAWKFVLKSCIKVWRSDARRYFFSECKYQSYPLKAFLVKKNKNAPFYALTGRNGPCVIEFRVLKNSLWWKKSFWEGNSIKKRGSYRACFWYTAYNLR